MRLKDLQNELNEYIEVEGLNTLEKQNEQRDLMWKIEGQVYTLLRKYNIGSYIIQKRNHIVITEWTRYPINNAMIDIIVRFKKGDKHSRYYYNQYYYIASIEIKSKDEDIETIEDVIKKINDSNITRKLQTEKEIESVKDFMKLHNLTYKETEEFVELFKKHQYSIRH